MKRFVITAAQIDILAKALGKVKVDVYADFMLANAAKSTIETVIKDQLIAGPADSEMPDPFGNEKTG